MTEHEELGLQELIYQVKSELLARNQAAKAKDPYPLFFIDKIELEIQVKVTRDKQGNVTLTVLNFGEASVGAGVSQEKGHTVKVSLSPLVPQEQLVDSIQEDPAVHQAMKAHLARALIKGQGGLAGEPE
jgi:hypothetical protein